MRDMLCMWCIVAIVMVYPSWDALAQTIDPTLLRITFIAPTPTPTAPPHLTPTATPALLPTPFPTDPPSSVPEPTTLTLFGLGAAALAYIVRHTRRRNNS